MLNCSRQIRGRSRFFQRLATKKLRLMDQAASEMSSLAGAAAETAAEAASAPANSRRVYPITLPFYQKALHRKTGLWGSLAGCGRLSGAKPDPAVGHSGRGMPR